MSVFVLVHGSWHGGWCWDKLVPLLEKDGHRVLAPDLPSHGKDRTPPVQVTLRSYTDAIGSLVDNQPERVILVGHSMAGSVISQVAESRPEKIERLVYLCAFLLQDGQSVFETASTGAGSQLTPALIPGPVEGSLIIRDDAIIPGFYADCTPADAEWAKSMLTPEPAAPVGTPVHVTEANFGRVPRAYIETLKDAALPLEMQRQLYAALPCETVISINSSHSPFLSRPEELAAALASLAG